MEVIQYALGKIKSFDLAAADMHAAGVTLCQLDRRAADGLEARAEAPAEAAGLLGACAAQCGARVVGHIRRLKASLVRVMISSAQDRVAWMSNTGVSFDLYASCLRIAACTWKVFSVLANICS